MEKHHRVTKVRKGWYKIEIVGIDECLNSIHVGPKKETHYLDIVLDHVWRGIPEWVVTSRRDSHERLAHRDTKHGQFYSLEDAKRFARDVADYYVTDGKVKFPDRWDKKYDTH